MKKLQLIAVSALALALSLSCGASGGFKVGMVTDSGTIDDKSFNQGTWVGLQSAAKELKVESTYLKPTGETEADYLKNIGNLYDTGFKVIVTPGFKFGTAIFQAQSKYKDAQFILLDAAPSGADGASVVGPNTVSVFFTEHESGFLAGVAAAVQLKEGEFGFIGGIEIPPVQKFNWGFQQGVSYANEKFGTKIEIKSENVVYQGSFTDVDAGKQIASTFFDRGVKVIFAAAGGVGKGAINEAKARGAKGEKAWIIGVDSDQFADGLLEDGKTSIILTSALKRVDVATANLVTAAYNKKFPGGTTQVFDAKNGGVGLPQDNPNLTKEAIDAVAEALKAITDGQVVVSDQQGSLIK